MPVGRSVRTIRRWELARLDRHEVELHAKQTQAFEEWHGPIDW